MYCFLISCSSNTSIGDSKLLNTTSINIKILSRSYARSSWSEFLSYCPCWTYNIRKTLIWVKIFNLIFIRESWGIYTNAFTYNISYFFLKSPLISLFWPINLRLAPQWFYLWHILFKSSTFRSTYAIHLSHYLKGRIWFKIIISIFNLISRISYRH